MSNFRRPLAKPPSRVTKPKGIRFLAALRPIGDAGRAQHAAAREYLLGLIAPTNMTETNLLLADMLIHLQKEKRWASKTLAIRCVDIVLSSDRDMKLHDAALDRSLAALSYVEWYAKSSRDPSNPDLEGDGGDGWTEIEPTIARALQSYLATATGTYRPAGVWSRH